MNHSSLRVAAIAVLTALITLAWASYGGQVLDGRQPYRAIPIEPGGLHPIPTSAPARLPATDAPRATPTPEVAPTPSPTRLATASPSAQAQAQRNEGPVTAALTPAPSPSPTPRPTPRPTATPRPRLTVPASHAPKPVTHRPVTSPKPVTNPSRVTSQSVAAARAYALGRIGAAQFQCLDLLWWHESNWQPRELNGSSGAYGIPQAVPGSKMRSAGADWRTNPVTQVKWGLGYIAARYGSACAAWAFWQKARWY